VIAALFSANAWLVAVVAAAMIVARSIIFSTTSRTSSSSGAAEDAAGAAGGAGGFAPAPLAAVREAILVLWSEGTGSGVIVICWVCALRSDALKLAEVVLLVSGVPAGPG
jgi:hypothetical protein